jgi:hypothetical protein
MFCRLLPPIVSFKILISLGLFLSLSIAQAATFTVSNLNDSGPGSLRQAVLDANATLTNNTAVLISRCCLCALLFAPNRNQSCGD